MSKAKKSEKIVNEQIQQKELEIKKNIENQYAELKSIKEISNNIYPEFDLSTEIENKKRVLKAEVGYTITYEDSIYDFCSGCYLFTSSKSAMAMLATAKQNIDQFLNKYIRNSDSITIILKGFTDGDPVNKYLSYEGEFGEFPPASKSNALTYYYLNDYLTAIKLKQGDSLNNSELAFLRAYSLREFFDRDIEAFKTKNTSYAYYGYTENNKKIVGGKYRKVSFVLKIINPGALPALPEQKFTLRLLNFILSFISVLISVFLWRQLEYHYRKWHDCKRDKQPYKNDRNSFWIILCIIFILLFITYIFIQPISLSL